MRETGRRAPPRGIPVWAAVALRTEGGASISKAALMPLGAPGNDEKASDRGASGQTPEGSASAPHRCRKARSLETAHPLARTRRFWHPDGYPSGSRASVGTATRYFQSRAREGRRGVKARSIPALSAGSAVIAYGTIVRKGSVVVCTAAKVTPLTFVTCAGLGINSSSIDA